MEYPFECCKCRKRIYAPSKRFAKCCEGASVLELVNICYLMQQSQAPNHNVVYTVAEGTPMTTAYGVKCVTACNAKTKPAYTAAHPIAVTCKKCLEWLKTNKLLKTIVNERKYVLDAMEGVEFIDEDDPDNSFKSKIEEVKKIDPKSIGSIPEADKILETLKSLSEDKKLRKILQQRRQIVDNLK